MSQNTPLPARLLQVHFSTWKGWLDLHGLSELPGVPGLESVPLWVMPPGRELFLVSVEDMKHPTIELMIPLDGSRIKVSNQQNRIQSKGAKSTGKTLKTIFTFFFKLTRKPKGILENKG